MTRYPDWKSRLHRFLAEARRAEFQRGLCDCAVFACDAVEAQTGVDLAADFRGYETARAGLRALHRAGFDSLLAIASDRLPVADRVRPGDLAAVPGEFGTALGVVQGRLIYTMNVQGLETVPLEVMQIGFRV